jgi:hypothetical protein
MSEFTFSCPLCQQDITCGAQYYGQPLQCPICQGEITAPAAEAKPTGSLGIKKAPVEKHAPVLPKFHTKQVVAPKKSGVGKMLIGAASILILLAALFFVVRYTGLNRHLPAFLGGPNPAAAEAAAAAAAAETAAAAAATPEAPPLPPPPVVWTTNLANIVIPTNAAYGKISTNEFKYDTARVDNGSLALRQGTNLVPDMELGVFFGMKVGESLSGKTIDVTPQARVAPRVWKKWKVEGKTALQQKVYSKGYTMKLKFGEVSEEKVPGTIYLCLPDEEQSVVAGSFVAGVGAAVIAQPADQTTAPAPTQMSEDMRRRYGTRTPARP